MTSPTPRQLEERLATLVDPVLGQDLVSAKCVKRLTAEDGRVRVEVTLGYPANRRGPGLAREIEAHLGTLPGVRSADAFPYLHLEKQTYAWGVR